MQYRYRHRRVLRANIIKVIVLTPVTGIRCARSACDGLPVDGMGMLFEVGWRGFEQDMNK